MLTQIIVDGMAESNLKYPLDNGYVFIAVLDKDWLDTYLVTHGIIGITNNCCIAIPAYKDNVILVTNQNGIYYLTHKVDNNGT
jgi:hypothetical protein